MESDSTEAVKKASGTKLLDISFPEHPDAVKILEPVEEDHSFLVNIDALERILCDPKVAGKNVSFLAWISLWLWDYCWMF